LLAAVPAAEAPPVAREGLPAGYRMRHDAHYVDQLIQPAAPPVRVIPVKDIDGPRPAGRELAPLVSSIARFGVLQPLLVRRTNGRFELIAGSRRLAAAIAAGLAAVPCVVHEADDHHARALGEASNDRAAREEAPVARHSPRVAIPAGALAELSEHLEAIGSCLNLFADGDRPLRERVARELIRAESQRAARLSQGLLVLAEDPALARAAVDIPALLQRVVDGLEPERVLSRLDVVVTCDGQVTPVAGDEPLLSIAFAGALAAMHALVERVPGALISCVVGEEPARGALVVEIGQVAVTLPASRLARFFDVAWTDRPGGYRAAIGVVAARRIAELHAGTAHVSSGDEGGCTLRLELPSDARGE
jgi:ParB-like chromosome segregation protein Spo0J